MAGRCGCSGTATCACIVKAGTNTTVTGAGTAGNPYVVGSTFTAITVASLDTPTVDMTVTGEPAGPNFVVSATVKLSETLGNVLTADATGLYLSCDVIAACAATITINPLDTASVNTTVTGFPNGPNFIVSSDVIIDPVAGNLLTVSPAGLLVANPVIQISAQSKLITTGGSWTPADVAGVLTSVGFSVLSGTADLIDSNGTGSLGLPVSASAQWSAEDANTLLGPQSITAVTGSTLVTWTERP